MKEIKFTPEEAIAIVCDDSKTPYNLLHMHEAKVRYGDMSTEYTFDIIFEVKETKEQFVIQGLDISEGSGRWFENDTLDLDFLDSCETDEITSFTAKPCVYKPGPPYTIINE